MAITFADSHTVHRPDPDHANTYNEKPCDSNPSAPGHSSSEDSPNSSAATTLRDVPLDLSKIPTLEDTTTYTTSETPTHTRSGPAPRSQRTNNVDSSDSRSGVLGLIQVKTQTRQKWSSNSKKGVQITTKHFYQEINSSWTVAFVILCFMVAGMIDAIAYQCYGVYVSMQSGNTILVALRVSDATISREKPLTYLKNLVSIGAYLLGSIFWNVLHRYHSGVSNLKAPLRRGTLFAAFALQSTLLITVALLATFHVISVEYSQAGTAGKGLDHYLDLLGIALLGFEAAGQVCISRVLMISDLPTIVISTLYHDLMSEMLCTRRYWRESTSLWDFGVKVKKQIRRFLCILFFFIGALIGGFTYSRTQSIAPALWVAVGTKMCICLAWTLWKKKTVVETVVETRNQDGSLKKLKSRTNRQ